MTQSNSRDSLPPRGAFTATGAGAPSPELPVVDHDDVDGPEISIDFGAESAADDLCADAQIPVGPGGLSRLSIEDSMRALIDLRLDRTRPSGEFNDFGDFDLQAPANAPATIEPVSSTTAMNSLAPVELYREPVNTNAQPQPASRGAFMWLAAAAALLLAIGVYRRVSDVAPTQHAAAAPVETTSSAPTAVLILGTPTIVRVPDEASVDQAAITAEPDTRTAVATTTRPRREPSEPAKPRVARVVVHEAAPELPATPSRAAIVAGFESVRDAVLACAEGIGGIAPIEATISGAGRITHASVGGYYQGTPQGSCIARVLRQARFAPFHQETFKVSFPYALAP